MPGPTALNVVVDGLAHLGPLSYLAPVEETIRPGDAVQVPVGKRIATGLVIGPGSPTKATARSSNVTANAPPRQTSPLHSTSPRSKPPSCSRSLPG